MMLVRDFGEHDAFSLAPKLTAAAERSNIRQRTSIEFAILLEVDCSRKAYGLQHG